MVKINLPPPESADPLFEELPLGFRLFRIFNQKKYGSQALKFRDLGRFSRFDHHDSSDPNRAIYYAAYTFEACIVEIFGDTRLIETQDQELAFITLTHPIKLLDLRGKGAKRAGISLAAAVTADRCSDLQ